MHNPKYNDRTNLPLTHNNSELKWLKLTSQKTSVYLLLRGDTSYQQRSEAMETDVIERDIASEM